MAQREISILVHDYVMHQNSGESAGASGSDRAARLRLEFDSSWAGTTKTVYFTDAQGSSSSAKTLGLDDLAEGEAETYEVTIPASALAYPGRATVTVRGIVLDAEGETERVITTAAIDLRVLDSRLPETVGELGQVDATAAEQLQAEIDGLKATFLDAVEKTQASETNAKASEEAAKTSETNAKTSETKAQISWAQAAAKAANAATSAENAQTSETNAKQSEENAGASATAAAASEASAKASEESAQASATAAKASEASAKQSETNAKASEEAATTSATAAKASQDAAQASEAAAKESQTKAAASETNAAKSETEAEYWASVAEGAAGGGVMTFKGRTGAVQPEAGDYTPEMVGADPSGSAATVQSSLDSHTSNTSNPHNVTAEQAGAVPVGEKGTAGGVAELGSDGKVPAGQLPAMDYDAKGSAATVQTNLDTHTNNTSNPHSVTYDQVGAAAASHTHSGSELTSAVPISKGGTGATTAADAMTNLGGMLTDMSNAALGLAWTEGEMPAGQWHSVCYGNGKFVAVLSGSTAAYSTDGITWSAATMPTYSTWYSVCYGNGKFVAVPNDSTAAYSTDGINWTAATLPSNKSWYSVCYGNGKFVAVSGGSSSTAAYSTDGINWTAATLPSSANWYSVCYGNGKFVAVANSSNTAAYSTDGINWMETTLPNSVKWLSVCYGNGKFVAISYNASSKTPSAVASATPSAISQLNAAGLTRMQLVSYVGTGTYGASNPSSLTFDFAPKVVLYLGASVDNSSTLNRYTSRAMFLDSLNTNNVTGMGFSLDVNSYPSYGGKNEDGKGVHWYGTGSAANQLNYSGYTYYFLALA